MGTRGPAPKRSDQRRRRNKPEVPIEKAPVAVAPPPEVPPADESWHPVALQWYESLARSGQSAFYTASDWALAYTTAESLSRDLKPQFLGINEVTGEPIVRAIPLKGTTMQAFLKANTALLASEGDRRRARIELQRGAQVDADEDAAVIAINDYQSRFTS